MQASAPGNVATSYFGKTILWQNDILAKHYPWKHGILAKWHFGKPILCQNNILAKWYPGIHNGPFSKINTVFKANSFGNWFTKLPQLKWQENGPSKGLCWVFDLYRKNCTRNMIKQTDPQEPEVCAIKSDFDWPTKCRLRRIVRCAKVGLRCVVSSRVPGRRDAALHEHALMSGVPCKDLFSQTWIWDLLSWKPCQWIFLSDSIGFCCVISVIVCKCCSLSLAVPLANNPTPSKYSSVYTDAQHQCKVT